MYSHKEDQAAILTSADIKRTENWLENGKQLAAASPSPLWDVLLKAGEKVLAQQRAELALLNNEK